MLPNVLKLIVRRWLRNRFYFSSLVIGFSLSFAGAGILSVFLIHELSADKFHKKYPDIYRVLMANPVTFEHGALTFYQLREQLSNGFPEVEAATHLYHPGRIFLENDTGSGQVFREEESLYVDPAFLEMFDFKVLKGNRRRMLNEPKSIVLTASAARRYFGDLDVLDRELFIKGESYTVTGLMEDVPSNSHIRFSVLISMSSLKEPSFRLAYGGVTYVLLDEKASSDELEKKMVASQVDLLPFEHPDPSQAGFKLQELTDVYFNRDASIAFLGSVVKSREYRSLMVFALITALILILSLFNYANFTQSKALFYVKDRLVERTFGAPRGLSVLQFVAEALLVVFISFIASLLLIVVTIDVFNGLMDSTVHVGFLFTPAVVLWIVGGLFFLSLLLGFCSYLISSSLKGLSFNAGTPLFSGVRVKMLSSIFLVQLIGSFVLTAFTFQVINQVRFIKSSDAGFFVEGIIEIDMDLLPEGVDPHTLKNEINHLSEVMSSSVCTGSPLTGRWHSMLTINGAPVPYSSYTGDADFVNTLGLEILEGRNFNRNITSDMDALLVNESAFKLLELDGTVGYGDDDNEFRRPVIGVVKDFHYDSFKEEIGPVVIGYRSFDEEGMGGSRLVIRTSKVDTAFLERVAGIWRKVAGPGAAFEYTVVSQAYAGLHNSEFREARLFSFGTIVALAICVFGLVGLSMFMAQKSMKAIAIKKVLGATVSDIATRYFVYLGKVVVFAVLISLPLVLYLTDRWLAQFKYKETPSWTLLVGSFLLVLIIVELSVSYQVLVAVRKNPAEVLKKE